MKDSLSKNRRKNRFIWMSYRVGHSIRLLDFSTACMKDKNIYWTSRHFEQRLVERVIKSLMKGLCSEHGGVHGVSKKV